MRIRELGIAFVLLVCVAVPAMADDELVGEIVDMACFISRGERGTGPLHTGCAQACAKKGMPLGLLTDDRMVYVLYPEHGKEKVFDRVKELAGQRAKLVGNVSEHAGTKGLEVYEVEAAE